MHSLTILFAIGSVCAYAQEAAPPVPADAAPAPAAVVTVEPGTHIPLMLLNSVSTRHSVEGDRVYLQSVFPILVNGRITIPPGSYVEGTVTELKRPGRVRGKGELFLRFDSLILPNGTVRDFRARVTAVDPGGREHLDRAEGKIEGDGNKGGDVRAVGETAAAGATIGSLAGAASHNYGLAAGVGAGAGAAVGLLGVLLTRGPDAVLAQGSTIELVLDRPLTFISSEINFDSIPPARLSEGAAATMKNGSAARHRLPF